MNSLSHFRRSHAGGDNNHEASFNLGSLQNSAYDNNKKRQNLVNSQFGKSSANSLHFISKNFSNSPVEEVGRDQGKSHLSLNNLQRKVDFMDYDEIKKLNNNQL